MHLLPNLLIGVRVLVLQGAREVNRYERLKRARTKPNAPGIARLRERLRAHMALMQIEQHKGQPHARRDTSSFVKGARVVFSRFATAAAVPWV